MDIFYALDAMFGGKDLSQYPSPWILQRFLASDPDFARAASEIQNEIRGPEETFKVWQALVRPMGLRKAPRLYYVGPKKGKAPPPLVEGLMNRMHVSRQVAEQMVELLIMQGKESEAAAELGVYLGD